MSRVASFKRIMSFASLLVSADGMEVARVQGAAVWDSRDVVAFIRRCLGNGNRGK